MQAVVLGGALIVGLTALANPGWHGTLRVLTTEAAWPWPRSGRNCPGVPRATSAAT